MFGNRALDSVYDFLGLWVCKPSTASLGEDIPVVTRDLLLLETSMAVLFLLVKMQEALFCYFSIFLILTAYGVSVPLIPSTLNLLREVMFSLEPTSCVFNFLLVRLPFMEE